MTQKKFQRPSWPLEPFCPTARPEVMESLQPYPYVYINADGTARELHAEERAYLETEFKGGDGAAPSIKDSYDERNGWGDINGYLKRASLPAGMPVADVPAENPNKPMSIDEFIAWLAKKGVRATKSGG
jgi:hypothetical protein